VRPFLGGKLYVVVAPLQLSHCLLCRQHCLTHLLQLFVEGCEASSHFVRLLSDVRDDVYALDEAERAVLLAHADDLVCPLLGEASKSIRK